MPQGMANNTTLLIAGLQDLTLEKAAKGTLQSGECFIMTAWVVCHEDRRSKRRCATVREMKEGPSRPAVRFWPQTAASCCRQGVERTVQREDPFFLQAYGKSANCARSRRAAVVGVQTARATLASLL